MVRASGWAGLALSFLLLGCSRQVGPERRDAGPGPSATDAGYDPDPNDPFVGPVPYDEARVRAIDPSTLPAGASPCAEPYLARVEWISDGDTINVRPEGAPDVPRVRMIGVDTPEVSHMGSPADCYGPEAADFTALLEGRLVWLTFDSECFDRYGRTLAYVHVGDGEGGLWERQLLRRGLASTLEVGANVSLASQFRTDEQQALMDDAGMWSACF